MDSFTSTDSGTAPAAGRRVDQLLAHYGESHRNPRNELIHFVAIPLIMLSLLGLLFAAHPWAAYAFVAASMVYYARLSAVFLAAMTLLSAVGLALVHAMGSLVLPLSVAIFVGAWIAQFVGHKIEGKKPSFLEDLQYLWVGPLFVLSKLFGRMGVRW
ncbi:MAG TPA: Mpo1-like protein [Ramlibacter sp.]|nr:Mpo1-like protein [Ramlibacter sp.]